MVHGPFSLTTLRCMIARAARSRKEYKSDDESEDFEKPVEVYDVAPALVVFFHPDQRLLDKAFMPECRLLAHLGRCVI